MSRWLTGAIFVAAALCVLPLFLSVGAENREPTYTAAEALATFRTGTLSPLSDPMVYSFAVLPTVLCAIPLVILALQRIVTGRARHWLTRENVAATGLALFWVLAFLTYVALTAGLDQLPLSPRVAPVVTIVALVVSIRVHRTKR